jgi:hypothetical protein
MVEFTLTFSNNCFSRLEREKIMLANHNMRGKPGHAGRIPRKMLHPGWLVVTSSVWLLPEGKWKPRLLERQGKGRSILEMKFWVRLTDLRRVANRIGEEGKK